MVRNFTPKGTSNFWFECYSKKMHVSYIMYHVQTIFSSNPLRKQNVYDSGNRDDDSFVVEMTAESWCLIATHLNFQELVTTYALNKFELKQEQVKHPHAEKVGSSFWNNYTPNVNQWEAKRDLLLCLYIEACNVQARRNFGGGNREKNRDKI